MPTKSTESELTRLPGTSQIVDVWARDLPEKITQVTVVTPSDALSFDYVYGVSGAQDTAEGVYWFQMRERIAVQCFLQRVTDDREGLTEERCREIQVDDSTR